MTQDEPLADEATHAIIRQLIADSRLSMLGSLFPEGLNIQMESAEEFNAWIDDQLNIRLSDMGAVLSGVSFKEARFIASHERLHLALCDSYKETAPRFPEYLVMYDEYPGGIPEIHSVLDPDEGLPEWQKRRNQSARAKADLIAKMKGKKK
jgi:hypothetical protein